jgi:carbonic anhydrase
MKITKSLLLASLTSTLLASTTHHTERHWDYSGEYGPENWGIFSEVCKTGKLQTPINIETSKVKHLEEDILGFKNYVTDVNAHVINNGHTIKVVPRGIYAGITVDGEFFKLLQFHMHTHSESTIDEVRSDLVVHLVHKSNHNELAVVGVFFDVGEKNEDVTHYWDSMPKHTGEETEISGMDISHILPANKYSYYTFTGSLTTPPCTEGVKWFILKDKLHISQEQIDALREIFPHNYRPIQDKNGREIFER